MDLRIVERENATPVGSHQRHFLPYWKKLTQSRVRLQPGGAFLSKICCTRTGELCSQLMIQDEASFVQHLWCQKETEHEDQ